MPLIDRFDHFLLDLDGVVYVGREPLPGSVEAIAELRGRGKNVRFLTNNPTRDPAFLADRLSRLGIPTPPEHVLPVAGAVLTYLRKQAKSAEARPDDAYVVGSPALKAYLAGGGLRIVEEPEAERARVVVVGGSVDFDYHQLKIAGRAARQAAHFLVCGRDAAYPMPDGPWPGSGAVVAGIEYMARREAISVGKPEPWLFQTAAETLPPNGRIVVVGDNLKSDVVGAQRAGYASVLALSGHTDRCELERSEIRPDYVVGRLSDVLDEPGLVEHA
jgi:HAD superfamily hydrolase (TIGR01450 family)